MGETSSLTAVNPIGSLTADLTKQESLAVYDLVVAENNTTTMRRLCLEDLFFLLVVVCRRKDMDKDWVYARVRDVEKDRNGFIDIWSREHYKSSVVTFGMTIQDILRNPDITVGIFSHTRPIAKAFLTQIKRELESNEMLKTLFPDVLYAEPWKESVKWSIDDGIIVKRSGNPKESTVEAWGMVDGMPTALDCETPVLTTMGWKHHGDLQPGDFVYGENGKPVQVIYNTGKQLNKQCYQVTFDDTEIIAAGDHLWPIDKAISPRNKLTNKQDSGWLFSKRELVKTSDLLKCNKRTRLPKTPVLEIPSKYQFKIDPYVLGCWLGDGSKNQDIITTQDYEILQYFQNQGYKITVAQDRITYKMFRLIGLRPQLKELSLLNNKHIPIEYLYANKETRLALLQGLMDTDGSSRKKKTINDGAQCVFTNTNRTLIEQTHYLAASLGLKPARIREYNDGNDKHNTRFTFSFTGILQVPPFRLTRKLQNCISKKLWNGRYVRNVEEIESIPVNCIQVEDPNGIYLAGKCLVPTHNSKHYNLMVFDDVVTKESVGTPDQIAKTTEAWSLALNLGSGETCNRRYVGTRYHQVDTYATIIERKAAIPRIYPATDDGTFTGRPVLWSQATFDEKVNQMGRPIAASQLLCSPLADDAMGFMREWLQHYNVLKGTQRWNFYIVVDAASEKKKSSDYTVILVIGLGPDKNYYLVDAVRDRMNLTERTNQLFKFVRKWRPVRVGYEKYGMQSDIEHIKYVQELEGYRFTIIEMSGQMPKNDRIRRLIPIFEQGRMYFPQKMLFTGYDGKVHDFVQEFITDELTTFPVSKHDDMLDCLARITDEDLNAVFPKEQQIATENFPRREYDPLVGSGYMTQEEYHPLVIR